MKRKLNIIFTSLLCAAVVVNSEYLQVCASQIGVSGEETSMDNMVSTPSNCKQMTQNISSQKIMGTDELVDSDLYSVSVTWSDGEAPEFIASPRWNPEKHSYDGWEFTADKTLTVTNTSTGSGEIDIEVTFSSGISEIQGLLSIEPEDKNAEGSLVLTLQEGDSQSVWFSLLNDPEMESETGSEVLLGTISCSIICVYEDELMEQDIEIDPETIEQETISEEMLETETVETETDVERESEAETEMKEETEAENEEADTAIEIEEEKTETTSESTEEEDDEETFPASEPEEESDFDVINETEELEIMTDTETEEIYGDEEKTEEDFPEEEVNEDVSEIP